MRLPHDFRAARRAIVAAVGVETMRALHRRSALWDAVAVAGLWGLFGLLVYLLATLPLGLGWAACFALQGFVIMAFGYAMHDIFMHRRFGGRFFAQWMGFLTGFVSTQRHTAYAHIHHHHHVYTGTDLDDAWRQDADTRWRRILLLNWVGHLVALRGGFRRERGARWPGPAEAFRPYDDAQRQRRNRLERRLMMFLWAALLAGAFVWPRPVLLGYLLPLFLMLPVANTLRVILEHGETNPGNVFHCATFYRTGFFTRVLFFWDAGDCHLVHHLFPHIPFYRMGRAVACMRPFLLAQGVRERRSLLQLLYGYFVRNEPHRALWSA